MNLEISYMPLWPTAIQISSFFRPITKKEMEILLSVKTSKKTSLDSMCNTVSKNVNVLDCLELKTLKKDLNIYLQQYWNSIFNCEQKIKMTNSWVGVTRKEESHGMHLHPNSIISGILYLQAEGDCGSLKLSNNPTIYKDYNFEYNFKNYSVYNSKEWQIPVKTNDIILFPSSIAHGTTKNTTEKERIILGFNSFVYGKFNNSDCVADLNLKI